VKGKNRERESLYLPVKEVAERVGLHPQTIYKMISVGAINVHNGLIRFGHNIRIYWPKFSQFFLEHGGIILKGSIKSGDDISRTIMMLIGGAVVVHFMMRYFPTALMHLYKLL
jgi:excisionase family DNA binding protein